jgi:hypothetical protein
MHSKKIVLLTTYLNELRIKPFYLYLPRDFKVERNFNRDGQDEQDKVKNFEVWINQQTSGFNGYILHILYIPVKKGLRPLAID